MILLDTNALLWLMEDHPHLGARSRALIDADRHIHFSAMSVTEIVVKSQLGRMPLPKGIRIPAVFEEAGLIELPFRAGHAAVMREFPSLVRHDPFDRMIVAQAKAEQMTLLTSDATLLALDESWILDARG